MNSTRVTDGVSSDAPLAAQPPPVETRVTALRSWIVRIALILASAISGAVLALLAVAVLALNSRPDLKPWHTVTLDQEFTAGSSVRTFDEYLELETRLFRQLDERIYNQIDPRDTHDFDRYSEGSRADPTHWPTNWNRTFIWTASSPRAGVLLLHGMSDSPYSLRTIGRRLHTEGCTVIGLRLPGHGTAPSGLLHVRWEDMADAVQLAMKRLADECDGRPLYIVGYSNGGALAVQYAAMAVRNKTLPLPSKLILLSPEIGISKLAGLAVWQERLGRVLGMGKLSWNSIGTEYDPFKYVSFALNAGKQAYRLTNEVQRRLTQIEREAPERRFPDVLAFQSVADATVSAPALIENLFDRLPEGNHELVLFDVNQLAKYSLVLQSASRDQMLAVLKRSARAFQLTAITNQSDSSQAVVAKCWTPKTLSPTIAPLDLHWPADVYSLSHIALPFSEQDELYGGPAGQRPGQLQLGLLALRGERGALCVSATDMLRLRWNPFYAYVEDKIVSAIAIPQEP